MEPYEAYLIVHFILAITLFILSKFVTEKETTDPVAWTVFFLITLNTRMVDTLPREYRPGVLYKIIVKIIICVRNIMLASFFIRSLKDLFFFIRWTMRLRRFKLIDNENNFNSDYSRRNTNSYSTILG